MPASIGVNLRVTGNCRQGGRKYMEDCFSVAYQQTEDEKDLEYAFFGIYDGHGGVEAASFAKEHLMETIIKHKNFWSENDDDVLRAIKDGYIATHYAMWREQSKWPRTSSGLPSTAGTTASVAFIRRGKIYIGHVGDSGIILGYQEPNCNEWKAKPLTKDHKPESPDELKRIESCGGKVVAKSGVPRVVWNRPRIGHQGPVRRSTPIDEIPFLAVARSLGDLWSYNSQINQFVVSPDPDCSVLTIDTSIHRCLIFGTDGLFNMLTARQAVYIVQQAERHNECEALSDDYNKVWLNPSKLLVEKALDKWHATKMRADNTSAVTLMLDPPGPPRAQVLKDRKKNLPESGLKIINRFNDIKPDEVQEPEPVPQTSLELESEHIKDLNISSSDVSSNYPLKERNCVKSRESLAFDPREPQGKENDTKSDDNTIQINEISSSNIEEAIVEDEMERRAPKRKLEQEDKQQRKSLRRSLTQKFLVEERAPAPCTLAEEKLKRMAEEAEKAKLSHPENEVTDKLQKMDIKDKKVKTVKKQSLKPQVGKDKLKLILTSMSKIKNKIEPLDSSMCDRILRGRILEEEDKQDRKEKVKVKRVVTTAKLSNFKRHSMRNASLRLKDTPKIAQKHPNKLLSKKEEPSAVEPLKKSKIGMMKTLKESLSNPAATTGSPKKSAKNKAEAKENIKVKPKDVSSSSKTPVKESKGSLKQRLQNKTKCLKKTVLKKTR